MNGHTVWPSFSDEELDALNMSLFELSENVTTPEEFHSGLSNILAPDVLNCVVWMWGPEFEGYARVGHLDQEEKPPIYLYVAYSQATDSQDFASHAELVNEKDLKDILTFSNMRLFADQNEESGDYDDSLFEEDDSQT